MKRTQELFSVTLFALSCRLIQHAAIAQARDYVTRPDLNPPTLTVVKNLLPANDTDVLFFAPVLSERQVGPVIFDTKGNLIWDGHELPIPYDAAHNLRAIEYQGSPHLIFTYIREPSYHAGAENAILDNRYSIVKTFRAANDDPFYNDVHEFELIENCTKMLRLAKTFVARDGITSIPAVDVRESVIQEVDLASGAVEFEWRSLQHVPVNQSCKMEGTGWSLTQTWDYFHVNSIQKDFEGNYIITAFFACTTYKINGTDGTIIWRLGGQYSDFQFLEGYELNFMHHVRILDFNQVIIPKDISGKLSNRTHLVISIFDNGFSAEMNAVPTASSSSGIILLLDQEKMTAQVIERYPAPNQIYGTFMGNMLVLPNGNRFIGWGGYPAMSEFTPQSNTDGDNGLVFHAEIANEADPVVSYRTYKGPWSAQPMTQPDLVSYSWTCSWQSTMYASWNGATDVHNWLFWQSNSTTTPLSSSMSLSSSPPGPFELAAKIAKDGFETTARTEFFALYAYVEALDVDGKVLGRSKVVQTRVPNYVWAHRCFPHRCPKSFDWSTRDMSDICREELLEQEKQRQIKAEEVGGEDEENSNRFPPLLEAASPDQRVLKTDAFHLAQL